MKYISMKQFEDLLVLKIRLKYVPVCTLVVLRGTGGRYLCPIKISQILPKGKQRGGNWQRERGE